MVGGLASVLFSAGIATLRPRCKALPLWTQYFQPAMAGLLIGIMAVLGAPQVMGAGYEAMDEAMHGRFTWQFLALLAGLKIVATLLSFVSGTPGGMFAPTLFIGAMLGAAVGGAEHVLLPHLSVSPGTYALVGMGVLFAGFLRAPMTSVFMVLEVSGNYSIIVPVIVGEYVCVCDFARAAADCDFRFADAAGWAGIAVDGGTAGRRHAAGGGCDAAGGRPGAGRAGDGGAGAAEGGAIRPAEDLLVRLSPSGWNMRYEDSNCAALVDEGKGGVDVEFGVADPADSVFASGSSVGDGAAICGSVAAGAGGEPRGFGQLEGVISQRDVLERYREFGEG